MTAPPLPLLVALLLAAALPTTVCYRSRDFSTSGSRGGSDGMATSTAPERFVSAVTIFFDFRKTFRDAVRLVLSTTLSVTFP